MWYFGLLLCLVRIQARQPSCPGLRDYDEPLILYPQQFRLSLAVEVCRISCKNGIVHVVSHLAWMGSDPGDKASQTLL